MADQIPAQSECRSELVALANRFGDQAVGDAFASVWPDAVRGPLPCDDAAIERVARALRVYLYEEYVGDETQIAALLLRAAGETP